MPQFEDRRCAACGHPDNNHGPFFGCCECPDERRCTIFVLKPQETEVKIEVIETKPLPEIEPPKQGLLARWWQPKLLKE